MKVATAFQLMMLSESKVLFRHDAEICFTKGERKDVVFDVPKLKEFARCPAALGYGYGQADCAHDDFTIELDFKFAASTDSQPMDYYHAPVFGFGCGKGDFCSRLDLYSGRIFNTRAWHWHFKCDPALQGEAYCNNHLGGGSPVPYDQLPDMHDAQYHHIATTYETNDRTQRIDDFEHFFLDGTKFTVRGNYWSPDAFDVSDTEVRVGSRRVPSRGSDFVQYAEANFCVKNLRIHQGALSSGDLGQELCDDQQDCSGNGKTGDTFRADGCSCQCDAGYSGSNCSVAAVPTKPVDSNCDDAALHARLTGYYNTMPESELEALTNSDLICRKGFADNWGESYGAVTWGLGWSEAMCKATAYEEGYAGWYYDWNPVWGGWCRRIVDAQVEHRISSKDSRWIDWPTSHSCINVTKLKPNRRLSEDFML